MIKDSERFARQTQEGSDNAGITFAIIVSGDVQGMNLIIIKNGRMITTVLISMKNKPSLKE